MVEAGSVVLRFIGDDKSMRAASKRFMSDMGKIAKRAALAAVTVAAASAKMAADFDKGMREISTLITNVTEKDIKNMGDAIKKLSIESSADIKSLSKANYDIISAGFTKASDSALVLNASAKLAVGGVTSVANAADITTTALNAYQMQAKEATLVSDILFTTVRLGKTTMDELGASLGQVLPFANAAELSLQGVGAAMATITASGINTRIATTALKNALTSLVAPTDMASDAMADAGKEVKYFDDGTMDLLNTIKQFRGLSLDEIMKFIPEKRAATAILSLSQNFDKLKQNLIEFQNVSGATDTAFEKMQKSFSVQLAKIKNIFHVTMINLGEEILPAILPVIQEVGDYLVSHAKNIASFFEKIGKIISAVATDFNTFVMASTGIVFAINAIKLALIGLNLVANANVYMILFKTIATGIPFLISLFKKMRDGADVDLKAVAKRMEDIGVEASKVNAVLVANAIINARENIVKYKDSLKSLQRQLLRLRKDGLGTYDALRGSVHLLVKDGKVDIEALTEELGRLIDSYTETTDSMLALEEAGGTAGKTLIKQEKDLAALIKKYTDFIATTDLLTEAQKDLLLAPFVAKTTTDVDVGFNLEPLEDTFEFGLGDKYFEKNKDEYSGYLKFIKDEALETDKAIATSAQKLAAKQKALYRELGSVVNSVANMMGSAFAAFSQDILDDNVSVKDSFKNLWETILDNVITSVAAMVGQLLILFAAYTLLNLLTGGNLGRIIKGVDEGGKFFQGLLDWITGSGEEKGDWIGDAFKDFDWGSLFGGGDKDTMNDGIITPKGDLIKTSPSDYIFATTDPSTLGAQAAMVGGGAGGTNININIHAMDGADVYRTLTDNSGKVSQALNNIVGRHFK